MFLLVVGRRENKSTQFWRAEYVQVGTDESIPNSLLTGRETERKDFSEEKLRQAFCSGMATTQGPTLSF